MLYQEPGIALSPMMRVGAPVAEVVHAHKTWSWEKCREAAHSMLARVGLLPTNRIFSAYPHQLSGGQLLLLIAVSFFSFALLQMAPGDYFDSMRPNSGHLSGTRLVCCRRTRQVPEDSWCGWSILERASKKPEFGALNEHLNISERRSYREAPVR